MDEKYQMESYSCTIWEYPKANNPYQLDSFHFKEFQKLRAKLLQHGIAKTNMLRLHFYAT